MSKTFMMQSFEDVAANSKGLNSPRSVTSQSSVDENDPSIFKRAMKLISKNKAAEGLFRKLTATSDTIEKKSKPSQARKSVSVPKVKLFRYDKGWNKTGPKKATWFVKEQETRGAFLENRKKSEDTWLDEQSMLTDEDFAEAFNVRIHEDKFVNQVVKDTSSIKKRNLAQFIGNKT